MSDLEQRIKEAEAIIRAQNRLQIAMYDSDNSAAWPTEANELQYAYEKRYDVDLDGVE